MSKTHEIVQWLLRHAAGLESIWLIGQAAEPGSAVVGTYRLLAFGDGRSLDELARLEQRAGVQLGVATGDAIQTVWGHDLPRTLSSIEWRPVAEGAAYYTEARWSGPPEARAVSRVRRKAMLLWSAAEAPAQERLQVA